MSCVRNKVYVLITFTKYFNEEVGYTYATHTLCSLKGNDKNMSVWEGR